MRCSSDGNAFEKLRREEGTVTVGALLSLGSAEGRGGDAVVVSRARTRGFRKLDKAETPAERGEMGPLKLEMISGRMSELSDVFELMFGDVFLGDLFQLREPEGVERVSVR